MKKITAAILSLTGLLLAAVLFSYFYVNEIRVSEYLSEALGEEYQIEVESASFNLLSRTLKANGIHVRGSNPDEITVDCEINEIELSRIGILDLMRGKVSIGSVELKNSKFQLKKPEDYQLTLSGFNLNAGPLFYDPNCEECKVLNLLKNTEISVDSLRHTFWENRYELLADSLYISEKKNEFGVKKAELEPLDGQEAYFQSFEYRTELVQAGVSDLRFHEVDYTVLRDDGGVSLRKISLDSADLHITVDKSMEEVPERDESRFPLEAFNDLPLMVEIDSVYFRNADIRYSEYAEDGTQPGTIHFANTEALFTGIRTGTPDPVHLIATSYLEESGKFNTEIEMTLDESGNLVKASGKLREFDSSRLNNIFVYLEGIHIKSGYVHELSFDFQMSDAMSEGAIWIHYDDLSIERIDKETLEAGFTERISGFFYDQVVLRSSSKNSGEDARKADISREREPERSFFTNLWRSLRSGIMDIIKRI